MLVPESNTRVRIVSRFDSDDRISDELHNLKRMQTRVFVVHLLPKLASRFFKKAKEAGMMQEGYAWIITSYNRSRRHWNLQTRIKAAFGDRKDKTKRAEW